jgi:hypothetical protein
VWPAPRRRRAIANALVTCITLLPKLNARQLSTIETDNLAHDALPVAEDSTCADTLSLQEAIKKAFRCNRERFVRLVLTGTAEHVREHLSIEDAAIRVGDCPKGNPNKTGTHY